MKKLLRLTTVPISLDKLLGKQLSFMSQYYEVTAISADAPELARVANKYGVKHHHIEMTRQISPLRDVKALWQFYRYCKAEKPFIVHSHTPKAGIVGMLGAKLAGVPNRLHTVAGLPLMEATGVKRTVLNFVEKLTYACATKVYPNSQGLYEFILKEKFAEPSKLKVLGKGSSNGIDTAFFSRSQVPEKQLQELRQSLSILPDDFVFIFVGRLVGDKGINELVHAFKETNLPQTKLLLVGPLETDLDALLPETLKEIENIKSIISAGYQDDVRPYFAISDALVFPSYREGFPNVVLQAGAMELPAIVSDINGCNEIIINGENGLIIPPKNVDELKDAMLKLLNDKELYNKLKKNTRPRIVKNYEQSVVWQAILEEYKTL
ncbi:glycosyl transferase family 1 [Kaistella solincola]|uniref:Glycosyl transferase family 1 n=1 Tax=Kaistella solincola TaxID=510955 RepID=A0ABR4ZPI2_9FLAO|nr:glycosyltransferase family 4 protein [Kaistella solincola]KIA82883.1 glycosyl transferase family 1 [Kaistella solincola]